MEKSEYIRTLKNEGFSDSEILHFAKSENFELSKSDFEQLSISVSKNDNNALECAKNTSNLENLEVIYKRLIFEVVSDSNMINISKLQKVQNVLINHIDKIDKPKNPEKSVFDKYFEKSFNVD